MKNNRVNIKEKKIYIAVIIIFVVLSILIGCHHEPWADEAHSWLISRDTSLYSLFFKYLHTDGHPALWHIILKIFQIFKFNYKYFFIIPIIFSSIGVTLFLFKSKFPIYIKILFPFTYFIFYQYTIVARGYCLLFPILCCLAIIWDEKYKSCYWFTTLLVLLLSTEAYTYIFAGMIYLFYIINFFKNIKSIKNIKSNIICMIILFLMFIITFLYVHPISTNTFITRKSLFLFSDSFVTPFYSNILVKLLITLLLIFSFYFFCKKYKLYKEFFWIIVLLTPVYLFYIFFYTNVWHFGILFLLFIFLIWIFKLDNKRFIIVSLITICSIQIYWTTRSAYYDYNNKYSVGLDVANFIKKYDYKNLRIYGTSFGDSVVNPYFDFNIFCNWNKDIAFFYWNTNNKFYDENLDEEYLIKVSPDIIMSSKLYRIYDDEKLLKHYNKYEFNGYSYFEDNYYEDQSIIVYVLKEIDDKEI